MGVRPEFQPTLPALMHRRFGWRERTGVILIVLAVLAFAVAVVLVRPRVDRIGEVVHRDAPAFTMEYRNDLFDEVEPEAGELARIEGRRGRQSVEIAVRPLELPPFEGDVAHAQLPIFASGHIRELQAQIDDFDLRAEHRSRVNDAPGYEIRFRTGQPGRYTYGSDLMLVPEERDGSDALLVTLRREVEGSPRLNRREEEFADLALQAMRSITYGTGLT
jgi:hypothetical protein